jgi:hypothetical protein
MDCVPAGRALVVKLTEPEEFKVPDPRNALLSKKSTVPAGVPVAAATVVVKVTAAPNALVGFELVRDVVVTVPVAVTVSGITADCDPAKLVFPV